MRRAVTDIKLVITFALVFLALATGWYFNYLDNKDLSEFAQSLVDSGWRKSQDEFCRRKLISTAIKEERWSADPRLEVLWTTLASRAIENCDPENRLLAEWGAVNMGYFRLVPMVAFFTDQYTGVAYTAVVGIKHKGPVGEIHKVVPHFVLFASRDNKAIRVENLDFKNALMKEGDGQWVKAKEDDPLYSDLHGDPRILLQIAN